MLNSENTLRMENSSLWQELTIRSTAFFQRSVSGLRLGSQHVVKIAGLGAEFQPLRFGDAALAHAMARGKFAFGGMTVTGTTAQIFSLKPPNAHWASGLHGLEWLRHFVASDQELHRIVARALVMKWGELSKKRWPVRTQIRALISLSLSARFLVGDYPSEFADCFYALIERHIRQVQSLRPAHPSVRLHQVLALLYASLAFSGTNTLRETASAKFCAIVDQIILPDGGHVSRNPSDLLDCLLDLIPVRDAMFANHEAVPHAMAAAVERMMPMLRMLSHGDHGLAGFQGCLATQSNRTKSLLEHDRVQGRPLALAPHSGYCRLVHGTGVLIMDVGVSRQCNSALALEFSDGLHRILANCGSPKSGSAAWQIAAADIAAHNTLEVVGFTQRTSASPIVEVASSSQGTLVNCQNTISGNSERIFHAREVFLADDGRALQGEDRIIRTSMQKSKAGNLEYVLRFHLHPTVKISSRQKDGRIILALPNRTSWQFSSLGGHMTVEESVSLGGEFGPRRTHQIVIRGNTEMADSVQWALRRTERPISGVVEPAAPATS